MADHLLPPRWPLVAASNFRRQLWTEINKPHE